jgi:hypothetical protein
MKRFVMGLILSLPLAVVGCGSLPTPKNTNGSISPSVAVAEAEIAYSNATAYAATYVTTCHADMTTIGCSESAITQIKSASDKALKSLFAAEGAVRQLPANATTGADAQIATMNADLAALKALTPKH